MAESKQPERLHLADGVSSAPAKAYVVILERAGVSRAKDLGERPARVRQHA